MVRGLSLDIKINTADWSKLRLVHGPLDYGDFGTEMQTHLVRFLEENEDAVVAIYFEVVEDFGEDWQAIRSAMFSNLKNTFSTLLVSGVTLKDMTFKYDLWDNHDEWPTLNEMRSAGQRLFILHDRSDFRSTEYGFMYRADVMKENFWEGLDDCIERYEFNSDKVSFPGVTWSRLFFMNHFDSAVNTVGEGLPGGGTNGWGSLYPRIKMCMESNGFIKPTIISLDWVNNVQQAIEIAQYLNFGGKIGSGQSCNDDSHCATEACNTILGLCQCKECSLDDSIAFGSDSCLGCEAEEYCVAIDNSLNECLAMPSQKPSSSPTTSPSDSPPTYSPTTDPTTAAPTSLPSLSPTTAAPTTTSQPSVTSLPTTNSTTNDSPTVPPDNRTTLVPTATTTPTTPTHTTSGQQSQASLLHIPETIIVGAKNSINNASKVFGPLSKMNIALFFGVLGQMLL